MACLKPLPSLRENTVTQLFFVTFCATRGGAAAV